MPQVFSAGWLYLFFIVMVISIVRIYFKLKTIQREAPMDRPVIKVAPIPRTTPDLDDGSEAESLLAGPEDFIRQGDFTGALGSLEHLLEDLSPTEDREARGKVLFRIGACHSRLATGGETFQHLLRAGEALREAVRLFTPPRYLNHYLRALGELAALYEDLAREKNPVEHLTQSARTCETAAVSAGQGGLVRPEAMFLARSGNAFRQLASHKEPQVNLRKATDAYEKAAGVLESVDSENAANERIKILKMQGDTLVDLAEYFQKTESLAGAVSAYNDALQIMDEALHLKERCVVLTDASRALLKLYDNEKSPAHLRQALGFARDAMEAAKGENFLIQKGLTMAVMGDALSRYSEFKDRRENLERAVKLYEASLEILKEGEEPAERERVRARLVETLQKITSMGEREHGRGGEKS
jgi:tetratricopeptide (TPR) repeat protein